MMPSPRRCTTLLALALLGCSDDEPLGSTDSDTGDSGPCEEISGFLDADGDDYGDPNQPFTGCEPPAALVDDAGDCDDSDPDRHPDAVDLCDGVDSDCDGEIDEDAGVEPCMTGLEGLCELGQSSCEDGVPSCTPYYAELDELCNGVDDDCDGEIDEAGMTFYADADGDGHGDPGAPVEGCWTPPVGAVANALDCDDQNPAVHADAKEICGDGIDNDCDANLGACRLEGSRAAVELSAFRFESDQPQSRFGFSFDFEGDVDGDGEPDAVIGAPLWSTGLAHAGAVFVFFGPWSGVLTPADADLVLTGVSANEEFGSYVSTIPDVNNDGCDEIAVGRGVTTLPWMNPDGGAYYFESPHANTIGSDAATATITGANASGYGTLIEDGRDIRGPQTRSLIVGGRAVLVPLPAVGSIDVNTLDWQHGGPIVRVVDDLNGDGASDLVVARPLDIGLSGVGAAGRVDLFWGPLQALPDQPDARIWGSWHESTMLGNAVVDVPGVDPNGPADLWLTTPVSGVMSASDSGSAIHRLAAGTDIPAPYAYIYDLSTTRVGWDSGLDPDIVGSVDAGSFGCTGARDLLVGTSDFNRVYVIYEPLVGPSDVDARPMFEVSQAQWVWGGSYNISTIKAIDDINGDGCPELAVGFPLDDPQLQYRSVGAVYVIYSVGGL